MDDGKLPTPSPKMLAHFEKPCDLWLAVDTETHDLIPLTIGFTGWSTGQFGHPCRISGEIIQELRVVQVGWCVGRFASAEPPRSKQFLVRPDGFEISKLAMKKHKITDERATSDGQPLMVVLRAFLDDISILTHTTASPSQDPVLPAMLDLPVSADDALEAWPLAEVVRFYRQHEEIMQDLEKKKTCGISNKRFAVHCKAIPEGVRRSYNIQVFNTKNGRQQASVCKRISRALDTVMNFLGNKHG